VPLVHSTSAVHEGVHDVADSPNRRGDHPVALDRLRQRAGAAPHRLPEVRHRVRYTERDVADAPAVLRDVDRRGMVL
jgi:hypothetical protein